MIPPDVKIVAGHGRDYSIDELKEYRDMMINSINIVRNEWDNGKNIEDMKQERILKKWKKWERGKFTCNDWIELICNCLKGYTQ